MRGNVLLLVRSSAAALAGCVRLVAANVCAGSVLATMCQALAMPLAAICSRDQLWSWPMTTMELGLSKGYGSLIRIQLTRGGGVSCPLSSPKAELWVAGSDSDSEVPSVSTNDGGP